MGILFGLMMLMIGATVGALLVDSFFSWFVFINTATMTFILPIGFLRYFWWRFNVWGEIVGIAVGIPFCILVWFVLGGNEWPFLASVPHALRQRVHHHHPNRLAHQIDRPYGPRKNSTPNAARPDSGAPSENVSRPTPNAIAPRLKKGVFFEFTMILGALACMFLAINAFLGHRLLLSGCATAGFIIFGGIVVFLSIRSLAEEEVAAKSEIE